MHTSQLSSSSDAPVLYVFSGAGLSAESGVATFRTAGGLWTQHNLDKVCNAATWKDNRADVFEFYRARRLEVATVAPNDAHVRLAQWQARWGANRVRLLTQNVDDLLERAGATDVVHLHGDLARLHCTACDTRFAVEDAFYTAETRCPKCVSLRGVKPAVVFFGEHAPEYAHLSTMHRRLRPVDTLLVVGSSLEVISADHLIPAHRWGHRLTWQVNPEPSTPEAFARNVAAGAAEGLAHLEQVLEDAMEPALF